MEDDEQIEEPEKEEENEDKWLIDTAEERKYWKEYIIKFYVYLPENCPQCSKTKFSIGDLNNTLNPVRFVCNNYKCNYRTNLRKFSFLQLFPRLPASVVFKILYSFISLEQNAQSIKKFIKNQYNINLCYKTITNILTKFRIMFDHYLKDIYRLNKLGKRNGGSLISIDEYDFVDIKGE